jgi:hypothetical protein
MQWVRRCLYLLAAVVAAGGALLAWGESAEAAVTLTVGGVAIADNGPNDLDPAADIIRFDSSGAQPPGFALPAGSSVAAISGKLVKVGNLIRLTDVVATRGAGANPLAFSFGTTFTGSVPQLSCFMTGYFANGGGSVGAGSAVTFACDAAGAPVPPVGTLSYTVPGAPNNGSPQQVAESDTQVVNKNNPGVTAAGSITLTTAGDTFNAPYSFDMYDPEAIVGGIAEPSDLEGTLPAATGGDNADGWSPNWLWVSLGAAGVLAALAAGAGRLRIKRGVR